MCITSSKEIKVNSSSTDSKKSLPSSFQRDFHRWLCIYFGWKRSKKTPTKPHFQRLWQKICKKTRLSTFSTTEGCVTDSCKRKKKKKDKRKTTSRRQNKEKTLQESCSRRKLSRLHNILFPVGFVFKYLLSSLKIRNNNKINTCSRKWSRAKRLTHFLHERHQL